jgi:hypothetical protein
MPDTSFARALALIAVGLAISIALVAAPAARGGTYRAALCNPDVGARHADAAFVRTSSDYGHGAACSVGGHGLVVGHRGAGAPGSWGAWVVPAPRGTVISRLSVSAAGRARAGTVPELLKGRLSRLRPFAAPSGDLARFRWTGAPTGGFAARLRCRRASGCDSGRRARIRVKRIALLLDDRAAPRLRLTGSLFDSGSRRGNQIVTPSATDLGAGLRRFMLQVNGDPVTATALACRVADRVATRLRPCRRRATAGIAAATESPPFRQGPNAVRVCAADYATTTAANRACAARRVRVDNLCPISTVGRDGTLRARLRRVGGEAIAAGRLLDEHRQGVGTARLCVATRIRLRGAAERVVATPLTEEDGRFRATIPAGPNREVRVAYWPSAAGAEERYLELRIPARPRLRLRPQHPIANGDRIRFLVRLPGPANGRRRVRIQVRTAPGHWLQLRQGLTDAGGAYRARYRFHATTSRQRYAFRALAPRQEGYPYEAGRSGVKRITVTG